MRVLIAEDDSVSALVLRRALERMGHEVTTAVDGEAAWEQLQMGGHRLLISDWMMPRLDGAALCRRIRDRAGEPYVYVILLTAKGTREDRLAGLAAGADDFLVKPLDTAELTARIAVGARILHMEGELQNRAVELSEMRDEVADSKNLLETTMMYLQAANQQFEEMFEGMPAACMTFDADGSIQRWNRDCERLFGTPAHEAMTAALADVFPWWRDNREARSILQRLRRGERTELLEWEHVAADGRVLHLLCNTIPLRGADGDVRGAISASIDISDRKTLENALAEQLDRANRLNRELEESKYQLTEANRQLADQAVTDGLTGLHNHRHFRQVLSERYQTARATGHELSVVLLDVDHFKGYNDAFGHPAGDEVLCAVAQELRRGARSDDLVARYGGEEFVVVLPGAGAAIAMEVADRLRSAIERHPWTMRTVTASFGVATLTPGTERASVLVDLADRAMYASKKGGRNRVTHCQTLEVAPDRRQKAA